MMKINRSPDAGRISIPPAALEAMVAAWPGMSEQGDVYPGGISERWLELPLPQERTND